MFSSGCWPECCCRALLLLIRRWRLCAFCECARCCLLLFVSRIFFFVCFRFAAFLEVFFSFSFFFSVFASSFNSIRFVWSSVFLRRFVVCMKLKWWSLCMQKRVFGVGGWALVKKRKFASKTFRSSSPCLEFKIDCFVFDEINGQANRCLGSF